jgi:hypothetical protein
MKKLHPSRTTSSKAWKMTQEPTPQDQIQDECRTLNKYRQPRRQGWRSRITSATIARKEIGRRRCKVWRPEASAQQGNIDLPPNAKETKLHSLPETQPKKQPPPSTEKMRRNKINSQRAIVAARIGLPHPPPMEQEQHRPPTSTPPRTPSSISTRPPEMNRRRNSLPRRVTTMEEARSSLPSTSLVAKLYTAR